MRMIVLPSRRAVLRGLAVLPAVALGSEVRAQAATRFRSVQADTSPLAKFGGGASSEALRAALQTRLQSVFGDLLSAGDKRAPALVARITYFELTSYVERDFGGTGPSDTIEGDGLVLAGGQTLSSTHILTTLAPSYSGADYLPDIDQRRVDSIANQFASWLRREMNL